jgi:hypothetical protein
MSGGTLESVAVGVAAALAAIHGSGIVHRDLKPANVLLSPVGPKVIDFGIARALEGSGDLTRSSQLMGTPSYMAPELLHGERATPAADVFAWGCLVAFAGTGKAPFDAATVPAVLHNVATARPRLEGLDAKLLPLVTAALDKRPENRPTSQQVLDQLVGHRAPAEEVQRTVTGTWTEPPSLSGIPSAAQAPTEPGLARPPRGPGRPEGSRVTAPDASNSANAAKKPRRGKVLLGVGAGVAAVALTAGLVHTLNTGDVGPPENLRSLYSSDFATNPNWGSGRIHDPDEDPYSSGYLRSEGLVMAMDPAEEDDPGNSRNWLAPVAAGAHSAQDLLISTDVRVEEGYEYLSVGAACFRDLHPADADLESEDPYPNYPDHEYSVSYRASVRADGAQATISKRSTDEETHDLATGDVPEFNTYPVLTADAGTGGQGAEEADPVSNSVKFSCVFVEDEESGAPTAELHLWINDKLAVSAVDEGPYPGEYNGHQIIQRQAIHYNRGQSTEPVRVLFESFRLDEILDD